ncbi:MAG TPA: sensor domain-containing diguanylate cyclase [Candidatus Brocadiaceae bacterium]|nr:sensor domain-containing diguanylate cyclase [Candidatus Brocadiaceae bacterium]
MIIDNDFSKTILENLFDGVYFVDCDRKILYWNKGAENITGYTSSEVIGKRCSDNINHVDDYGIQLCMTTCPLAKTVADSMPREMNLYIRHKKGHRVPVLIRTIALRHSLGRVIGAVEIFSDSSPKLAITQKIKELEKMALLDPLTELANRRYIELNMQTKLDEMRRYGRPFGILFMDIDHFKKVNDLHGHDIGDKVLIMVSNTFMKNVRASDIVGRWGGEEFLSIMPNINEDQLYFFANKLRVLVEQSGFSLDSGIVQVTVSIGATLAQPKDTTETLLERADKLLYYSKATGRNRVSIKV